MGRIIGKTERMPTIPAHVFGVAATAAQKLDEVARNHADRRMADDLRIAWRQTFGFVDLLEERVPAKTRELLVAVARGDVTHMMSKQAAQIAHFLLEGGGRPIRIVVGVEQQRMSALRADVFMTPIALGELLVMMLAEKARERVTHAGNRAIFGQVVAAAPAPPVAIGRRLEDVVVDVMPPQRAREPGQ